MDVSFWKDKHVFSTGHTGFKGSWLSRMLIDAGANVTGYALELALGEPSLFLLSSVANGMESIYGDIRDIKKLKTAFSRARSKIAIHMAA